MVLVNDSRELEHALALEVDAFIEELVWLSHVYLRTKCVSGSAFSTSVDHLVGLEAIIDLMP